MTAMLAAVKRVPPTPATSPPREFRGITFHAERKSVDVPDWVTDLASFRRWVNSDAYPEKVRICFLHGELWVDLSREDFFPHNQIKGEFAFVWTGLIKQGRLGRFVPDGMPVTDVDADLFIRLLRQLASAGSLNSRLG